MSEQIRISWEIHNKDFFSISKPEDWEIWEGWEKIEYIRQKVYEEIVEQIQIYEIDEDKISCKYVIEKYKDV